MYNTKKRHNTIQEIAMELISDLDVTKPINYRWVKANFAIRLSKQANCHIDTANKHIKRAIQRRKDPNWQAPQWGGNRYDV